MLRRYLDQINYLIYDSSSRTAISGDLVVLTCYTGVLLGGLFSFVVAERLIRRVN